MPQQYATVAAMKQASSKSDVSEEIGTPAGSWLFGSWGTLGNVIGALAQLCGAGDGGRVSPTCSPQHAPGVFAGAVISVTAHEMSCPATTSRTTWLYSGDWYWFPVPAGRSYTAVGTDEPGTRYGSATLKSPSLPPPAPQQYARPPEAPHAYPFPAFTLSAVPTTIAVTPLPADTGTPASAVVPTPSWPSPPSPQHHMSPTTRYT